MSKKVHPYSHRMVILRDWKSRWFATDKKYSDFLRADIFIKEYLMKKLKGSFVSVIEIERSRNGIRVIIKTSRPGVIIGRQGEGAKKLKDDLLKMMRKNDIAIPEDLKVDIVEVSNPDADAKIVALSIVEGLEKRLPFRRVLKQTLEKVMAVREVKGARILIGGRLNGADMARTEYVKKGSIPLQTFRADVDFARERANMSYGVIGIKVWIYKGEVFDKDKK
ncbi:MAG: 30S ribosomal protein S3 [Candidatus Paceibacterota bacterium]